MDVHIHVTCENGKTTSGEIIITTKIKDYNPNNNEPLFKINHLFINDLRDWNDILQRLAQFTTSSNDVGIATTIKPAIRDEMRGAGSPYMIKPINSKEDIDNLLWNNFKNAIVTYNNSVTGSVVEQEPIPNSPLKSMSFIIQLIFWFLVVVVIAIVVYFIIKYVNNVKSEISKNKMKLKFRKTSRYL